MERFFDLRNVSRSREQHEFTCRRIKDEESRSHVCHDYTERFYHPVAVGNGYGRFEPQVHRPPRNQKQIPVDREPNGRKADRARVVNSNLVVARNKKLFRVSLRFVQYLPLPVSSGFTTGVYVGFETRLAVTSSFAFVCVSWTWLLPLSDRERGRILWIGIRESHDSSILSYSLARASSSSSDRSRARSGSHALFLPFFE